jgi:hypothetical protein
MVCIYGEARRHSELEHGKSTVKDFLKRYFSMHEPL